MAFTESHRQHLSEAATRRWERERADKEARATDRKFIVQMAVDGPERAAFLEQLIARAEHITGELSSVVMENGWAKRRMPAKPIDAINEALSTDDLKIYVQFLKNLAELNRSMQAMDDNERPWIHPKSIFNIRERNAMQRQMRDEQDARFFGTQAPARPVVTGADGTARTQIRLEGLIGRGGGPQNAASVPYVSERQTRHEPMTGYHSHDHASMGHGDHDDGIHFHEHFHNGDAVHDHAHTHALDRPAGRTRPGRGE